MKRPSYDATLKAMVDVEPGSWRALLGTPRGRTTVVDGDIATVSGAADKVLHVASDSPYMLQLEFVAGHDASALPPLLLFRNSALACRHKLPVLSAAILLRQEADSPQLTGAYECALANRAPYARFEYEVLRIWQMAVEPLLRGGAALLPLAPIANVTDGELPGIIDRIKGRVKGRGRRFAEQIWGATYILLGLRHSPEMAADLLKRVISMEESSTYQAILSRGRTDGQILEARRILRLQGDRALGVPDARTAASIERLSDLRQLEEMLGRIFQVTSWNEVLGKPKRTQRKPRPE